MTKMTDFSKILIYKNFNFVQIKKERVLFRLVFIFKFVIFN